MASSALHATPEHWTELIAARKQSSLCSEQINVIKKECAEKCGKKQILECPTCYGKAIERMRERYNEGKDREWFTQRTAFLHELDGLLTDAKEHRNGVKLIEARIESEKEAWYRWVLRKYPEFLAVSDDGAHLEELRGMLDDPDRSREELVAMMWQGVGKPAGWSDGVDRFAAKVAAAGGDKAELKKLYISEFFMNQDTNEVLEYAKPYLDEYSASDTMRLEEIMGKLAQDSQESKSTQPQRDSHISRLDDLRRARTAYEQNKAQLKSRQQKAQGPTAGEDLYNLPPCLVCRKPANAADVLSCSVCQAVTQMGGIKKLTVYCSEECYHKGHDKHVEAEHNCEGGKSCVQLRDEDSVVEDDVPMAAFVCKDCFKLKKATLFCSERCALENIARHRQSKHEVKTEPGVAASLICPLAQEVEATLKRENPGLEMTQVK